MEGVELGWWGLGAVNFVEVGVYDFGALGRRPWMVHFGVLS